MNPGKWFVGVRELGLAETVHGQPPLGEYLYVIGPFWRRKSADNCVQLIREAPDRAELARRAELAAEAKRTDSGLPGIGPA